MISKDIALEKVRKQYPNCYITEMSNWDEYMIFYLKAKDPDRKTNFNTPFEVVVNKDGKIGSINLGQLAKSKNRYDEYLKLRKENMVEIDKVPDKETKNEWFDELFNEFSNQ